MTAGELLFGEFGADGCIECAKAARERVYKARCTKENDMWSQLREGGALHKFKAYNESSTDERARLCVRHADGYANLCLQEAALSMYIDCMEASRDDMPLPEQRGRKRIGFSHRYPKIHGQTSARLLAVNPISITKNTPRELLEYDTSYEGGHFELKRGKYIQLVFLGNLGIPFCTIRPAFPSRKVDYYNGAIGEWFDIKYKGGSAEGLSDFGKKVIERLKKSRDVFGERVNAIEAQVS